MKSIRSGNNSGFDYRLFIITIFLLVTLGLLFNFSNCKIEMQSMNDTLIGADPGSGETKDVILLSKWTGKRWE